MPVPGRTTPCAECPWRVTCLPGYVGDDDPAHFYWAAITHENPGPCHTQVDYNDPDWQETQLPDVDLCAGQLIHFKNMIKLPITPLLMRAVQAVKKSAAVFTWPNEYFEHHMPHATKDEIRTAMYRALNRYDPEWMGE